jgi:hypothetical protein
MVGERSIARRQQVTFRSLAHSRNRPRCDAIGEMMRMEVYYH